MLAEDRQREIRRASEYVKGKREHRESQTDIILDILCGILLFGFGIAFGVMLMGGGL